MVCRFPVVMAGRPGRLNETEGLQYLQPTAWSVSGFVFHPPGRGQGDHPGGGPVRCDNERNQRGVGAWRSLVAHLLWEQGAAGSNPAAPTNAFNNLLALFIWPEKPL